MASQSPCPLMCNGTTISTIKLSSHFSSAYGSVSFVSKRSTKRSRFVASSLRDSSSSSTSTSSPSASTIKNGLKKSLESECSCSTPPNQTIELIENLNGNVRSKISRRSGLSFKSLFGRRALWRRIFFASKKVRSILLLNIITVIYASNIPVVKEVEALMDPAAFTVVRFAVSAIPFIPFIWRAKDDISIRNAGFELGIWVSLGYLMQALGLQTSDAGRASFISTFTVIVVPLLDGMLGAIVPARTWFGALMSILGVALLESSGSPPCVGDLLNFLGAVFFGVHMLRTEHIARNTKREKFLPLLGYEVCVVAFMSTLWYLVGGWSGNIQGFNPSSWTLTLFWDTMISFPWIPTLYTGVFSTGLCLWIEMAAMRDVSATETAIIYGLEPVWGAGFAWFLLGERWGYAGWFGASLVLVGSLTVQIFGSSSPSKSSKEEKTEEKLGLPEISDNPNGPSASPVVVHSREDRSDLLR